MVTHGKECILCILTTIHPASFFFMNVSNFRVSVAWSRVILSDGSVNQLGVQHYTNVFEVLTRIRLHAFVRAPQLLTSPCSL